MAVEDTDPEAPHARWFAAQVPRSLGVQPGDAGVKLWHWYHSWAQGFGDVD